MNLNSLDRNNIIYKYVKVQFYTVKRRKEMYIIIFKKHVFNHNNANRIVRREANTCRTLLKHDPVNLYHYHSIMIIVTRRKIICDYLKIICLLTYVHTCVHFR